MHRRCIWPRLQARPERLAMRFRARAAEVFPVQLFAPRANTISRLVLLGLVAVPLLTIAFLSFVMSTPFVTRKDIVVNSDRALQP